MKPVLALAALLLAVAGCANRDLAREYQVYSGVVTAIEVIDPNRVEGKSGVRTSVFFGFGSGGRRSTGMGMGMGIPLGDEDQRRKLVRYEVELADERSIVAYYGRQRFEIGDCVQLRIHPNAERYPPKIDGASEDCED